MPYGSLQDLALGVAPGVDPTLGDPTAPPPQPEQFQTSGVQSLLEAIYNGMGNVQLPPARGFGQGFAQGLVGSLGGQGSKIAAARQRFEADQASRRAATDAERRAATTEARKESGAARRAADAEQARLRREQQVYERDNPIVPPEALKANPALARVAAANGGRAPVSMLGKETPAEALANTKAEATARAEASAAAEGGGNVTLGEGYLGVAARGVLSGLPITNFVIARGKEGAKQFAQIANRVGTLNPDADLALARAGYGADKASLQKAQTVLDGMQSFKKGTQANMENLRALVKRVPDVGLTPVNAVLRSGALAMGSKDMAQFQVFQKSVSTEAARIINNANIYLDLSERSRKDLGALKDGSLSVGQTLAALDALNAEFANRSHGQEQTLEVIKARIKDRPGSAASRTPGAATEVQWTRDKAGNPVPVGP